MTLIMVRGYPMRILVRYIDHRNVFMRAIHELHRREIDRLESTKIVKYIDPYDITILNSLQVRDLVEELSIFDEIEGERLSWAIGAIKGMSYYCLEGVHRYLWIYGD